MTNHTSNANEQLKPWTAPRLESLEVAATLTGTDAGKEGPGTGNTTKKLLS